MKIELTKEQIEVIGIAWLKENLKYNSESIVQLIFKEARVSKNASWLNLLELAVKTCSKNYLVSSSDILGIIEHDIKKGNK